ncbi:MAG TPA: class I SAM-dependent methyltransferase [Acidimicrobiia bacterium]|jgi:SAM-dependent methyltransferase|nr:class I SAM-dependent methyltransferase [Acidimicrobiia bacterium]
MSAPSDRDYTPAYTLDNRWRAARERLEMLEAACDPLTARHLDTVGVGSGWQCLEAGAGAGSVARMLCERVGADGRVVAVDLEPALLADLSAPNLAVERLDVVTDELPEAAFDLVHTRAVLLHIPQRNDVVPKLIRALRPGGVLLLEELELTETFAVDDDVFRPSIQAMYRPLQDAGMDVYWAATMQALLEAAGLEDVDTLRELMTFTGQSPLAEFFRITYAQFLESQPYTDAERALMQAGSAALAQPGGRYVAWEMVTSWGRRP